MAKLVLGYPGSGLSTWVSTINDPTKVVWQDSLDLEAFNDADQDIQYVCAALDENSLAETVPAKVPAIIIYPATIALGEYYDRQTEEGLDEDTIEYLTVMQDIVLSDIREDTYKRNRHIVLGRGEYAGDFLEVS